MSTDNTPAPQVEMVSDEMVVEACLAYEIAMDGDVRRLDVPWIAMKQAIQAALNARAGGDAKDAERYRVLRDAGVILPDSDSRKWFSDDGLDAAIDAALASQAVGVKDGRA